MKKQIGALTIIILGGLLTLGQAAPIQGAEKSAQTDDNDEAPFEVVGVWEIVTTSGPMEFITIGPQGAAIRSTMGEPDSNGHWESEDEEVIIYWQDGWMDVLSSDNSTLQRSSYPPGGDKDDKPAKRSKLRRLNGHQKKKSRTKATSWSQRVILDNCVSAHSLD